MPTCRNWWAPSSAAYRGGDRWFGWTLTEAQRPARFTYALTLDTHLPLASPKTPLPGELKQACGQAAVGEEACQLLGRLGDLLAELGRDLEASPATPFVVIAGDHAPPFAEAANQSAFDPERVPVLILAPKGVD